MDNAKVASELLKLAKELEGGAGGKNVIEGAIESASILADKLSGYGPQALKVDDALVMVAAGDRGVLRRLMSIKDKADRKVVEADHLLIDLWNELRDLDETDLA